MTQDTPGDTSAIDIDAALANPSAYFAQPRDVLAHPRLSRELQLKLLNQWEQDARGLAQAESEGMGGEEESMLARVRQALRALDHPQETSMNDTVTGGAQASIGAAARSVAGGLQKASSRVQHAASRTQGGVTEIREVIRAQPITAALLILALGYLFGRLGSLIPSGGRR
ncbi:MAG TPA: hypothetical protein VKI44_15725 [Acetobacteraceae bacterium]|nr:hypothetical protein [Acetobacteraceae bacterium]